VLFRSSYPGTIGYALFSPSKLVNEDPDTLICPPSLAIAISVFLYWFSWRLADELIYPGILSKAGVPSFSTLALTLTGVAISVMLLRFTVRNLFGLRINNKEPIDELRLLSYPACVGLLASAITTVLAMNFPHEALSLSRMLDAEAAKVSSTLPVYIQVHGAIGYVSAPLVILLSGWSLLNVIRTAYQTSFWRSLLTTISGLLVVGTLVILVAFSIGYTEGAIDVFHQKYGLKK